MGFLVDRICSRDGAGILKLPQSTGGWHRLIPACKPISEAGLVSLLSRVARSSMSRHRHTHQIRRFAERLLCVQHPGAGHPGGAHTELPSDLLRALGEGRSPDVNSQKAGSVSNSAEFVVHTELE